MKKTILFVLCLFLSSSARSQQIAFKPSDEFSYQLNKICGDSPFAFTEDMNNDGVMDYYAYLCKGNPNKNDPNLYDSTIVDGFYRVLRNADGSIRKKVFISSSWWSGPCLMYDFNKDGKNDLLYAGFFMKILYRTDSLSHIEKEINANKGRYINDNMVSDINKDGLADIVSTRPNFNNYFYMLYQYPNDSFRMDTLINPIPNDIYNSPKKASLKVGDFNHDGKMDLMIYVYSTVYSIYFYLQEDSGKFILQKRDLPNRLHSIAVLDYNHDGWDDILAELISPKDSLSLLAIPQTTTGISALEYEYRTDDNLDYSSANAGDKRLTVQDLNCDGYPEVIRFGEKCDNRHYIYETKYDTTFSKLTPFNLSQQIGVPTYISLDNNFFDWNGDGRLDLTGTYTINDQKTQLKYIFFKNISTNDQTNYTLLKRSRDTLQDIKRLTCFNYSFSTFKDTIRKETLTEWRLAPAMVNPATGLLTNKVWVKYKFLRTYFEYGEILHKSIYEDSLFLVSGSVCKGVFQDTLRQRNKVDSYLPLKYRALMYEESNFQYLDTSFTNPSGLHSVRGETVNLNPVPTKNNIKIHIEGNPSYHVSFLNAIGEKIEIPKMADHTFDTSNLKAGMYMAIIDLGQYSEVIKFTVE